jgi:hypothetical protein
VRRACGVLGVGLLLGAAAGAAACDSGGDEPRSTGRDTTVEAARPGANAVRLRRSYTFGRRRQVDAEISFGDPIDPYRQSVQAPVPGTRMVAVRMGVLNRGRDAFPLGWAVLQGYDERGRPLPAGTESTPLRKTRPERPARGQLLTRLTAFRVPRGRRLASIRMSSGVNLWRFRARWSVPRG